MYDYWCRILILNPAWWVLFMQTFLLLSVCLLLCKPNLLSYWLCFLMRISFNLKLAWKEFISLQNHLYRVIWPGLRSSLEKDFAVFLCLNCTMMFSPSLIYLAGNFFHERFSHSCFLNFLPVYQGMLSKYRPSLACLHGREVIHSPSGDLAVSLLVDIVYSSLFSHVDTRTFPTIIPYVGYFSFGNSAEHHRISLLP